jgi:hypothetical protein
LLLAAALASAVTAVLYLPVCDLVYDCGCTWVFAGGSSKCNIHNAAPPHCPACTRGLPALGLALIIAAPALAACLLFLRRRRADR